MTGNLADTLTQIKERAPHARVYVVGYPDLLPTGGAGCGGALGITAGDIAFLNREEVRLNGVLEQVARAAGDGYVDTYAPSQGHDACAAPASRWLEPLLPSSPAAPLHPNAAGERGMADAVVRRLSRLARRSHGPFEITDLNSLIFGIAAVADGWRYADSSFISHCGITVG